MTKAGLVPLKYVVYINRRALPETTSPGYEFRYIDISAAGRGTIIGEPQRMTFDMAPSRARRLVCSGDTIVSTVRTYLRAVCPMRGNTAGLVVSTGFAVLTPGPRLYPRYLGWWAQSDLFIEELVARSVGVSYPAINPAELGEIAIQVPTIDRQREVADFLDCEVARMDRMVGLQRAMASKLTEREAALLDGEIDRLANTYGFMPFRRFIQRVEQGTSPECDSVEAAEDQWGVLKVSAVKDGIFQPNENKLLPSDVPPFSRYEIHDGDLLVTRANTPALVGAATVVRRPRGKLLLCDKIFRIHVSSALDKEFFVHVARGSRIRTLCAAASHGTSRSMTNLKVEEIKKWPVPAASVFEQRRLAKLIDGRREQTGKLLAAIDVQLDLLAERRRALITAAVTGQTDVITARGGALDA